MYIGTEILICTKYTKLEIQGASRLYFISFVKIKYRGLLLVNK